MHITSEPVEPRQVQLTIVVPPERIEQAMREVAQHFARRQRIRGYRPGKVPLSRVVAVVGEEVLREAASEQLHEDVVREAIVAEGLRPSAPTTIELVEKDPLTIRAVVPLEPEVDLRDYLELRLPRPELPEIDDEAADQVMDGWRNELAALETVDRAAEAGDTVSLSLVGRLDDAVVFDDDALTLTLGPDGAVEANLPPGVVDELIGLAAADTAQFTISYSELWPQPELQGREVSFEARVDGVLTLVAPELNDDLAQELGGVETVQALRERVRHQLQFRQAMDLHEAYVGQAVDALVERADVTYPPVLVDAEVAKMLADLRGRIERQGFTWDHWLKLQNKDEDAIWDEAKVEAEARLRRRLVMSEFVRSEGLGVTPDEIDNEVRQLTTTLSAAARRGMPSIDDMRRNAGSRLLSNRAVDRLLDIITADGAEQAGAEQSGTETGGESDDESDAAAITSAATRARPHGDVGDAGDAGIDGELSAGDTADDDGGADPSGTQHIMD